mmetsp:Transcript_19532/g.32605  ORF Transcript_19532/g.32605 Transcript_19532/m.32605 type:complete len:549 (-) Transcript_19532:150-1796(-)|eukprot:CAMPEP_0119331326 /NCGR_PEP_ID=MMETSP1333-20130426/80370_1 /TAXON_ID=418940 /ORGANISM="Scyphosphaera apsteinii, Strain RCC1455" /LENGTH=548 /DNA_ID=CAMNT_0007340903 /DNA_START=116 /DNA_END=1762 /DNA_ORIENTATION=+
MIPPARVAALLLLFPAAAAVRILRRHFRGDGVISAVLRLRGGHAGEAMDIVSPTTLDPVTPEDWDALRSNAHALLDASINRIRSSKEGRVWTPVPDFIKEALHAPLPRTATSCAELCARLESLLPYGVGNTHPRFFGWVHGSGSPSGVLSEVVTAAMNANCGGRDHVAIHVEKQVLEWARAMMGFPANSGALLVSGTSMATIIALKAARDIFLGFESSRKGGVAPAQKQHGMLVGYMAQGAHSCIKRAFDILGLGSEQLHMVPVKADFTMDVDALNALVAADRKAGLRPFVVIGTAGSVNVGAIDDLDAIANFCAAEHLWFHVDGAFGATAVLSPEISPRLKGMERASSIAFDFHKWLHVNYDCGCVLVRDQEAHLRAFSDRPDYLAANERGLAAGSPWPVDFGPELSRGFRALKVWSHFTEHGTEKLGAAITHNVEQASYLAQKVNTAPDLELLAPASLQIVVFRYVPLVGNELDLDALNDALVVELQERGIAAPSTTRINGKLAIRVNITNHRTRVEDLDMLMTEVQRIGAELAQRNAVNTGSPVG